MSLTRIALGAVLLGACCLPTAAGAAESTILPGYWESSDTVEVLFSSTKVSRKCLTADQVEQWLTAPATRHYSCTYDQRRVGGGQASFHGVCKDKKGRTLTVAIKGAYEPEHFHLVAHFHYMLTAGIEIPGDATTDAHRISAECPAPADPNKPGDTGK
ncbi:MAG: DUF3617 family protein [Caulobacteraceae bacterium]